MTQGFPAVRLAIMNPASSPGTKIDSNYVSYVNAARAAGLTVIGYVTSSYGAASVESLKAQIDKYYSWYNVDGIFFDEGSNNCTTANYYATLNAYVKSKGGKAVTIINPGTNTQECFIATADIICNFEGPYSSYQSWSPYSWVHKYDANRFWHIVHTTSESNMPQAISLSRQRKGGWIYVTPDVMENPYDTLPPTSYWERMKTEVAAP